MAIDMGELKNKETIILPIIWERDASRGVLMGFTIDSWKILNFVTLNSNMIELKKSVSRWTNLRRKISPIIWRKQSTFDTERSGGSLNNSGKNGTVRDRSDFNDALTTLNRLHQESGERQLRPVPFWLFSFLAPIIEFFLQLVAMERFLVELMIIQRKSTNELTCKAKPQTRDFQFLFCCSWIVYSWRRSAATDGGGVKTTPHKSIFTVRISTRNSRTGQKVNKFGALTTSEFVTQNDKSNNMWNDLKHVETHEHINWWLVNAVDWTTAELVCFCSVFSLSLLIVPASLDCFPCSHDRTLLFSRADKSSGSHSSPHRTRMSHLVVSAVPDLFDTSIHFFSFLIISLITLLFLLPDKFNFHDVVDQYLAYFRWGPWHSGRERASHMLWAQRPLHHGGLCRIHPGVLGRAAVPWWFRLRWRHHRQDASWRVPKTSRSLCRKRHVVQSVVVSQSW